MPPTRRSVTPMMWPITPGSRPGATTTSTSATEVSEGVGGLFFDDVNERRRTNASRSSKRVLALFFLLPSNP